MKHSYQAVCMMPVLLAGSDMLVAIWKDIRCQ